MKLLRWLPIFLVALCFLTAIVAYPKLPEKVASHWNLEGKADGYMDRAGGAFFVPVLSLFMLALFYVLPRIDPLKKNYAAFRNEYDGMVAVLVGFMYYVYLLTLLINFGHGIDIVQWLSPAFAVLFYYVGILLGKAKQNWFVGIRTPWTLESESVWDKTHAVASRLFKAAGVAALLGVFVPQAGLMVAVALAVGVAVFTFFYSYWEFQREKKRPSRK